MKKLLFPLFLLFFSPALLAEVDAETAAKSNNPLANMTALSIHHYYMEQEDVGASFIRFAKPFVNGKLLLRATLPITNIYTPDHSNVEAGLGDFNAFLSYNFITTSQLTVGAGPMLTAPTAVGDLTEAGSGGWQPGIAAVAYAILSPQIQAGGLITWGKTVINDEDEYVDINLLAIQPFLMLQAGNGLYLRSVGIMQFDLENSKYHIPFGIGVGKIIKSGNTVVNVFLEPTFTVATNDPSKPVYQVFAGINFQFL